jgi:N-acetylmuramoyl-L-alanine amidase
VFSTEVGDKLLKRIRVAETSPGVTRVVFDLESVADYAISRRRNPSRLIVELRPAGVTRASDNIGHPAQVESNKPHETTPAVRELEPGQEPPDSARTDWPNTETELSQVDHAETPAFLINSKVPPASSAALPEPAAVASIPPSGAVDDVFAERSRALPPPAVPKAARASRDGERSMIRALGLKITRVVVDPGHGGTDRGTVGQHGLMEKDLVLDVAKRLGKLIEERMGSEVIYTRLDDTFVGLHSRTEIANEKKADLFLSIHANFSPHPRIGGIDVYYLNLTRSTDALDVAARENASSERSVFELRDLIQSITLHDKIEESKEFAGKVQRALQSCELRYNASAKNRGVKKAPFAVLIGASMPSILAEIGFLSNAREEQLLKRSDHRQRLAEALYQGVSRYAQSLSHFQVAQRASSE